MYLKKPQVYQPFPHLQEGNTFFVEMTEFEKSVPRLMFLIRGSAKMTAFWLPRWTLPPANPDALRVSLS
jgi:hypothetical protein